MLYALWSIVHGLFQQQTTLYMGLPAWVITPVNPYKVWSVAFIK